MMSWEDLGRVYVASDAAQAWQRDKERRARLRLEQEQLPNVIAADRIVQEFITAMAAYGNPGSSRHPTAPWAAHTRRAKRWHATHALWRFYYLPFAVNTDGYWEYYTTETSPGPYDSIIETKVAGCGRSPHGLFNWSQAIDPEYIRRLLGNLLHKHGVPLPS